MQWIDETGSKRNQDLEAVQKDFVVHCVLQYVGIREGLLAWAHGLGEFVKGRKSFCSRPTVDAGYCESGLSGINDEGEKAGAHRGNTGVREVIRKEWNAGRMERKREREELDAELCRNVRRTQIMQRGREKNCIYFCV